jgi:hypothetical protein
MVLLQSFELYSSSEAGKRHSFISLNAPQDKQKQGTENLDNVSVLERFDLLLIPFKESSSSLIRSVCHIQGLLFETLRYISYFNTIIIMAWYYASSSVQYGPEWRVMVTRIA